jgi:nucleoside-diphosphate-sugar epimerase
MNEDLSPLNFDLVVSSYGRLRYIAKTMAGRTGRFIGITGGGTYVGFRFRSHFPKGLFVPIPEDSPVYVERNPEEHHGFMIAESERELMAAHQRGDFQVTILRYPAVYGPRQLQPRLWPIIKRIMDRRPFIIVPGNGLRLNHPSYADNVAQATLLAVDCPQAVGQIYNVGDERYPTLLEVIDLAAKQMGHQWEIIEINHPWAKAMAKGYAGFSFHTIFDIHKIRSELGYRDLVQPAEGVERTVTWLLENHKSAIDPRTAELLADGYDYALEDRFVGEYRKHMESLSATFPSPPSESPYYYSYKG